MATVHLEPQEVEFLLAALEQVPVRGTAAMRLLLQAQEKLRAARDGAREEEGRGGPP